MFVTQVTRRLLRGVFDRATLKARAVRRAQSRLDSLAARRRRFLICIPYLKSGGGERVAANIVYALSELYGPDSCAVLVTDWSGLVVRLIFPENVFNSYPAGVPIVDVVALSHLPYDQRMWELMTAVMSMRPEIIINVNSETMWNCYERFAPELSRNMRLGAIAFCHVGDKGDRPIGYTATHLERVLPFLDLVVTDNQSIINQLRHVYASVPVETRVATETEFAAAKLLAGGMDTTDARHHLAASLGHRLGDADWAVAKRLARHMTNTQLDDHDVAKFSCLYQYTDPPRPRPATRPRSERPQILWASRVTRTKFPELLPRIARLLPDCDIHAYGAREIGYRFPAVKNLLFPYHDLGDRLAKAPNLFWHGPYKRFAELPLERFDAMLYTGLYDGLPNVLLEAGANRLPIIAPVRVGGIGELIDERTGWPVTDPYDARAFAESFRELVHRPEEARIRADALADLIARRHSLDSFRDAVRDLVENPTAAVRATPVTLTTADALEMEGQPHDPALVPSGGSLMSEVQILESQQVP